MARYLDDDDVAALLPLKDAVDCVERAFRLLSEGSAVNEVRHRSQMDQVTLNVMWAIAPPDGVLGVKAYPAVGSTTKGAVLTLLLYSTETGELLAVLKADKLGQLRTGAASAVATRALAGPEPETMALFGTGYQAEGQALAVAGELRSLRNLLVVGRSPTRRDALVDRLKDELDIDVSVAAPEDAARSADVVSLATGATEPVLHGRMLSPGAHVNAVGSNVASKREVDRAVLTRAGVIAVDDTDVARLECGDLLANDWDPTDVVTLGDVLTGRSAGRRAPDDVTLFESQGLALLDIICAAVVYSRAVESGRGRQV